VAGIVEKTLPHFDFPQTLRVPHAMEAGVADDVWSLDEMINLL
jgi:hypothetical protein